MGNAKETNTKSRRGFFTSLFDSASSKQEKVKMLTPDGKLVEVDKSIVDVASQQKVTNKEILQWMKNPSKKDL